MAAILDVGYTNPLDIDRQLIELDREDCKDLVNFIRLSWHLVEPGAEYVHSWHIDFLAAHLEAITNEEELDDGSLYNRLLINIPPGTMKSLLVNVFWPAWEWGPCNMPHLRYICASHNQELAVRDGLRMRRLIEDPWYKDRWPHVELTRDQNQKTKYENTALGFRQCSASNSITGARADRVIIDDPLSVSDAMSQQVKDTVNTWFCEAVPTRLVSPKRSAIIVIMQRLAEDDVSATIIERGLPYDHIMLPMRYDPSRAMPTMLGMEDPRSRPGELLFPARFPIDVVERDEEIMGKWATAGQFAQAPQPRGGGVILTEWWQMWDKPTYPPFDYIVAAVDGAYTTKTENDPSAMTVWGIWTGGDQTAQVTRTYTPDGMMASLERTYKQEHPKCMLIYAWAERLELHELVEKVRETMNDWRVDKLLVENKASGYSVAQELRRVYGYDDFGVQLMDPKGQDKLARLYSVQHLFSDGLIYAPDREFAQMVIDQVAVFPKGRHDDLVDTTSMALRHLRDIGLLVRGVEWTAEVDNSRVHVGSAPEPLYPV